MCSYDPRKTDNLVGVYECPECGELVLSGEEHPEPLPDEDDPILDGNYMTGFDYD